MEVAVNSKLRDRSTTLSQTDKQKGAIKNAVKGLVDAGKSLRLSKLRYMLFFSLAPIFPHMKNSLFTNADSLWGMNVTFAMGIAYSLGIGLIFLFIQPGILHKVARFLAIVTAALFVIWVSLPLGKASLWVGIFFSLGLGSCSGVALFGFTYALNDVERLFGAALTVLFCMLSQLLFTHPFLQNFSGLCYLGAQVLVTLLCLTRFQPADYLEYLPQQKKQSRKLLAVVLSFFFVHRAIVFFYSYLPHAPFSPLVGIAGIIVFLISMYIFFRFKFNIWYLISLFFAGMFASFLIHQAYPGEARLLYADILQGFGYMGYIASYYMLGSTLKRQADYHSFRLIILVIFVSSTVLHVAPGILNQFIPRYMPMIGGLMTLAFFILFTLLSPVFFREVFPQKEEEEGESAREEEPLARRRRRMQEYKLTAREQELVLLLLQGDTLKECAATLDISLDTVKFHSKNIYRKLGVSGRSELLSFFKDL